jgi:hypothetical protein
MMALIPVIGAVVGRLIQCPITGNPREVSNRELSRSYLGHLSKAGPLQRIFRAMRNLLARVKSQISIRENWEPSPYYKGRHVVALGMLSNLERGIADPYTAAEAAFSRSRLSKKILTWLEQRREYWRGWIMLPDGSIAGQETRRAPQERKCRRFYARVGRRDAVGITQTGRRGRARSVAGALRTSPQRRPEQPLPSLFSSLKTRGGLGAEHPDTQVGKSTRNCSERLPVLLGPDSKSGTGTAPCG